MRVGAGDDQDRRLDWRGAARRRRSPRHIKRKQPGITIEIGKGLGTKARIEALAGGKIDIAMASHGLALDELAKSGMTVQEIARTPVVFGVNGASASPG